eukprot:TRINITY_DN26024_c0_g1_i1.p1 TRINITY_DN26024_c0_g1~~TRINITY_DN26024_c0_g1_i1.p1  ORF type:complete len:384 (+),score=46.60 TRINITY_DN26024_c0_g1_i1:28-1179(+)
MAAARPSLHRILPYTEWLRVPVLLLATLVSRAEGALPNSLLFHGPRVAQKGWHGLCGPRTLNVNPVKRKTKRWRPQPKKPYRWKESVLVHYPSKLAFCRVAKVANSQFALLFNDLNGFNVTHPQLHCCGLTKPKGASTICFHDSVAGRYNISVSDFRLQERGWHLAVFVRDPLERFLSAFLSVCGTDGRRCKNNYTREICCMDGGGRLPRTSLNGGQDHDKALQEDAVRAFEMLVHAGAGMPRPWMQEEVHFKTQLKVIVEDCGFDPMLIKDFWHLNSDRENVNRQVKQMLVTIFGKSVRQSSRYVDKFFPPEGHADVRALRHSTAASERLRTFYRYRETVQKVLDYVKNDYATFGMHLPDWIQGIPSRTDVEKGRRAMMRMR